jgi:hypothetical protein
MPRRSGGPSVILRDQYNRTFAVGLAGATIASLGLFTLSRADGEIGDEGRAKTKATSDWVSSRRPVAANFHSDIEAIAFNLQFNKRERYGDPK